MFQCSEAEISPLLSMGSPSTFMTLPSTSSPTGTLICVPQSSTVIPRHRPSVAFMAMHRATPFLTCASTSRAHPPSSTVSFS